MTTTNGHPSIPTAGLRDTLGVLGKVVAPTVAKGVIIRRPRMVAMAEKLDLDRRAVERLQALRAKYGTGPVMLKIPGRRQAVVLDPAHVRRVLDASPEPFATASAEKRAALSHFEPKGALISHGEKRADRRRFNEEVLGHENPMHRMAADFVAVVEKDAKEMLANLPRQGVLSWSRFAAVWFRIVRQVVFGQGAREDHELSDLMEELRQHANWAFLSPKRRTKREAFHARLREHLHRAEPGSLAAMAAQVRKTPETAPEQQVPQWLFAFDPAGMTTFRALALLASHPQHQDRARQEIADREGGPQLLPFLRAANLEALRLWPTTPLVLRETTQDVTWEKGVMPAKTGVILFAPYFHRDDENLAYAHRFAPEVWLEESAEDLPDGLRNDWPLIPFSSGPGICPARHLVLLMASSMLRAILRDRAVRLTEPARLDPARPLAGTLNHFTLRFELE